jgi:nucleoside-diphosphate-sugar epimerase
VATTIFGDGGQTRGFRYVRDMVDNLQRLMESEERYPVNLGLRSSDYVTAAVKNCYT